MLLNTRRRMLGLLAAAIGAPRLIQFTPSAFAAETGEKPASKKSECFALQAFGDWKGTATNKQAGARIGQLTFSNPDACDLRAEIQVAASYDAKLVVFGDPDGTPITKDFLVKPDNRIIAKNENGTTAVDEPLCGVCTDIRDDKVSIVLPLSTGALFRSAKSVDMAVKLGDAEECNFTLNCEDLRKALDWAVQRKDELAKSFDEDKCTPPAQGCFLTTACCEVLGLSDDCFELRTLRRYRDRVLVAIARRRGCACRLLSCGAVDIGAASAREAHGPALVGLCALPPAERARCTARHEPSRLFSLCAHDGRAFAQRLSFANRPIGSPYASRVLSPRRHMSSPKPRLRRNQDEVAPQSPGTLMFNKK